MSDINSAKQNPYHTGLTPPPPTYPTYPTVPPVTDVTAAAAAHGYAPPPSASPIYSTQPYGTAPFQQQTMNYGYAPRRPSSGLAVTSLITGISAIVLIWFAVGFVAAIAAVITGHMALNRMKVQPELGGRGMAISGLILGYVTIGLAAMFALFLIAIFGSVAALR